MREMVRVLFMGRKPVAARCLDRLIFDDRFEIVGVVTDHHLERSVTADTARRHGLPLFEFDQARAAIDAGELCYDLGVSMLYWRRLKGCLLGHPSYGTINFHPAPLPEYKGVGGYNLAILNRLDSWAVSAHFIDEGIDTGPIIQKNLFPIDPDHETAQSLERKSQLELEALFCEVMERVAEGPNEISSEPGGPGIHLKRKELESMKRVDLEMDDVDLKIRAFWFPPYDGAYIEVAGERFTLVNRSILESLADPDSSSLFTKPAKDGPC
jgi:methionyl-tRNA formyltransferase